MDDLFCVWRYEAVYVGVEVEEGMVMSFLCCDGGVIEENPYCDNM